MFQWLAAYGPTILICAGLLLVVVLAVRAIRRDKRQGKCSCGGSCGSCPMGGSCHATVAEAQSETPAVSTDEGALPERKNE